MQKISWKLPVVPRRGLLRRVKRMLAKSGLDEMVFIVYARGGRPIMRVYRFRGDSSGRYFEDDGFHFPC